MRAAPAPALRTAPPNGAGTGAGHPDLGKRRGIAGWKAPRSGRGNAIEAVVEMLIASGGVQPPLACVMPGHRRNCTPIPCAGQSTQPTNGSIFPSRQDLRSTTLAFFRRAGFGEAPFDCPA